jgi:hypothetical protein
LPPFLFAVSSVVEANFEVKSSSGFPSGEIRVEFKVEGLLRPEDERTMGHLYSKEIVGSPPHYQFGSLVIEGVLHGLLGKVLQSQGEPSRLNPCILDRPKCE